MARKDIPEISAGSMADIAFLLLIFFLVTTTMEKEAGMMRLLPEIEQKDLEEVRKRDVVSVLVNDNNKILLKGKPVQMGEVKNLLAEIVLNEAERTDWPENLAVSTAELEGLYEGAKLYYETAPKGEVKTAKKKLRKAELRLKAKEIFGSDFKKSKHVVSIQSTRGAEYNTYIELSDQILLGYKEMRIKAAKKQWNKTWSELTKEEKEILILMYPANVSEAQTVDGTLNN